MWEGPRDVGAGEGRRGEAGIGKSCCGTWALLGGLFLGAAWAGIFALVSSVPEKWILPYGCHLHRHLARLGQPPH